MSIVQNAREKATGFLPLRVAVPVVGNLRARDRAMLHELQGRLIHAINCGRRDEAQALLDAAVRLTEGACDE